MSNGTKINIERLYDEWDAATSMAFKDKTKIMYSTEFSNKEYTKNILKLDDIDGDLWIGLVFTPEFVSNIKQINIII